MTSPLFESPLPHQYSITRDNTRVFVFSGAGVARVLHDFLASVEHRAERHRRIGLHIGQHVCVDFQRHRYLGMP